MSWNDGLDANGSRILTCGLSYADIVSVAGVNQRTAANRLGVDETHFYRLMKRLGTNHWFPPSNPRSRCIKREDVIEVAQGGVTQKDAAYLLGVSYGHLNNLVKMWELRSYFPANGGDAIWKARKGYCD